MKYPDYIEDIIRSLSRLPGVGPKTAERYAFYLLEASPEKRHRLVADLNRLESESKRCSFCRAYSQSDPCPVCSDKSRNKELLCIVENSQDMVVIENTKQFQGYYFVLDKLIDTLKEIGPKQLPLKALEKLIKEREVKEMIIALNFSLEGESTSLYLKKTFPTLKISRLARGLPSGSDLEYADELTLANALKYRHNL